MEETVDGKVAEILRLESDLAWVRGQRAELRLGLEGASESKESKHWICLGPTFFKLPTQEATAVMKADDASFEKTIAETQAAIAEKRTQLGILLQKRKGPER